MRISDWRSDVCSSDLAQRQHHDHEAQQRAGAELRGLACVVLQPASHLAHASRPRSRPCAGRSAAHRAARTAAPTAPCLAAAPTSTTRATVARRASGAPRSEEHTSELQSLMRISYAVFCLKKKKKKKTR